MSWNHFVDNELINTEGMTGQPLTQGSPEQTVIEEMTDQPQGPTGQIQEGMTDMDGSEPYGKLTLDVKMLFIYFAIFLGGLFLGGPILFYYFLLAGSNYFPDKPGDVLENADPDKPMASTFLKLPKMPEEIGEARHFQIFLDKKLYSNSILNGPSFPDKDGNVKSSMYQYWPVRYLWGFLSYSLIYYFKFSSIISNCLGPNGIVYLVLFIVTYTIITIVSLIQKYPDTNILSKAFSSLAPNITGIYFFYPVMMIISIVAGCFMLFTPLKEFTGDIGTDTPVPLVTAYQPVQLLGVSWTHFFYVIFLRYLPIIILFTLGLSLGMTIIPLFMMGFIGYCLFTPSGCYILSNEKITLNVFGAYKLFWVYCSTCVPYFLEIILLVFVIIACLIDTEKGSKIQFGAWVAGTTFILWLLNFKKFAKFRRENVQYFNNIADGIGVANAWIKASTVTTVCDNIKIEDTGEVSGADTNTKGENIAYNNGNEAYKEAKQRERERSKSVSDKNINDFNETSRKAFGIGEEFKPHKPKIYQSPRN